MGKTSIEWTDDTINPLRARRADGTGNGHYCEKISPGCLNCYSSRLQPRFGMPSFQEQRRGGIETFLDPKKLEQVLRRRKPTKFFWEDMSDMFGDWVPFDHIAACFGIMAATPHHTHQVLTKRPDRALAFFAHQANGRVTPSSLMEAAAVAAPSLAGRLSIAARQQIPWPLPNVWLGVSVEDQQRADERIPLLLQAPAAVRFLSVEPLLGPVSLDRYFGLEPGNVWQDCVCAEIAASDRPCVTCEGRRYLGEACGLHWVIVGGESGRRARPMHPAWALSLRDQCAAAGVSFFFKQWGEYGHANIDMRTREPPRLFFERLGKKKAGRLLDGRTWDEMPTAIVKRDLDAMTDVLGKPVPASHIVRVEQRIDDSVT